MHNFFTIEVEAGLMRQERERAAAADARAAHADAANRTGRWLSRAFRSLENARALAFPGAPLGTPLVLRRVPRPVEC